jgi:hypothetical protein
MPRLYLRCKDRRFQDEEWELVLKERGVSLIDPDGEVWASFPRRQAEERFVFPSFWESVKDLGVKDDEGTVLWFVPDSDNIARIKDYLHVALADQGPEAIAALRRKGWLLVLGGAALTLGSLGLTAVTLALALTSQQGGTYIVAGGAAIFGLILVARGVGALVKGGHAAREMEESVE